MGSRNCLRKEAKSLTGLEVLTVNLFSRVLTELINDLCSEISCKHRLTELMKKLHNTLYCIVVLTERAYRYCFYFSKLQALQFGAVAVYTKSV